MINLHCPICDLRAEGQAREEWPNWPFCSARCRLIDLGRWLGERYAVAPDETEDAAESNAEDNP